MAHEETVAMIQAIAGGNISNAIVRAGTLRPYRWCTETAAAAAVLRAIFPFLIAKRGEALIALEHRAWVESRHSVTGRYSDSELGVCSEFSARLKASRCTMASHLLREAQ